MNKFRWLKHFGWDSMIGRHLVEQPRARIVERIRARKIPRPPQFERRNYPETSR